MPNKVVVPGKVEKQSNRKFKIKTQKSNEKDVDIDIVDDGEYDVEKLSVDEVPTTMSDGKTITWLNNFAIKKGNSYINQPYKVKIVGLGSKPVVILDNNSDGKPYYFTGPIVDDTIELSDGDPGIGQT